MARTKIRNIPTHQEIIDDVNEHLEKTGERPSSFGRRVLGDSSAVARMADGTDPRLSTIQKIYEAINK